MNNDIERLVMKPSEVALALGVCRETVYTMIKRGDIPSVLIGNSLRVPVDELKALIAGRTAAAPAAPSSGSVFTGIQFVYQEPEKP